MNNNKRFMEVFEVFQDTENYIKKVRVKPSNKLLINQLLVICFFTMIYGFTMGISHSYLQAVVAGVKLIILFISTVIICLPSFYIIQLIFGSKINIRQVLIIILSGFVMSATVMVAFSPIILFFLLTGGDYYFMQLLHIGIFLFSGFFGIRFVIEALKLSCEKENLYPKIGLTVFKIWAVIFIFVGVQLAWNLRPFLGDKGKPFAIFREYEGNFYTAVIYSVKQIALGDDIDDNSDYINEDSYNEEPELLLELNNELLKSDTIK